MKPCAPSLGRVGERLFVDLRTRPLHGRLEEGHDVLRSDLVRARRLGDVVVEHLLLALHLFVNGAHRHRARDLAGRVPAHTVGHDEEPELLVDEEVVLVVIANLADVGGCVETDGVVRHSGLTMMPRARGPREWQLAEARILPTGTAGAQPGEPRLPVRPRATRRRRRPM
jgi:hypothetical protein